MNRKDQGSTPGTHPELVGREAVALVRTPNPRPAGSTPATVASLFDRCAGVAQRQGLSLPS